MIFDGEFAVVIMQTTNGSSRTPAGCKVAVYGPDDAAALAHDFEVEIPRPRRGPLQLTA